MKHNKLPFTPNEHLDQHEQALAKKHQQRLRAMTQEALYPQQQPWHASWVKPAMVTAFSVLLVSTVIFLKAPVSINPNTDSAIPPQSMPLSMPLPEWVMDTDIPLTLIENLEFYDWLAQQPEEKQAKFQQSLTLAINEFHQYRFSQRRSSEDLTERFAGAVADFRTVQR